MSDPLLLALAMMMAEEAPVIPFEIINVGTAGSDTDGTETSQPWETVAGTTLLVAVFTIGAAGNSNDVSTVAFNGSAMTEIGIGDNPRDSQPGQQWFYIKNPSIGSATITYTKVGANWSSTSYHIVQCFNIRGEAAAPIGATNFPNVTSTAVDNQTSSITSTAVNSILLAAGSWQGGDTDPFTALEDLTKLTETQSGSSTSSDGATVLAWKQLTTITAYNYGFSSSSADGHGISAVEILAP